jgi:hypothetical protein
MTTLAAIKPRSWELGSKNDLPVIAADIIYQGAAVGDNASGYMRPLVSGDQFRGFCLETVGNSDGSAGDLNVQLLESGKVQLSISGLAITDVGRPVYATDDDTFVLTGIGSYIGRVTRYVSSGVGIVAFDATKPEEEVFLCFQVDLASIADGDVVTTFTPGFHGRIKDIDFVTNVPASTASKASTLNLEIGTTNVTGGTVALTTAACNAIGKIVAGAAITAGAAFTNTDTISVEASSTTAFAEGSGTLVIRIGK